MTYTAYISQQATLMPKRANLSVQTITAAAIALADAEGIDALSMRRLAAQLGVTAMSLYNHVANKDALLDLMLDAVAAQIEIPQIGAPWQGEMRRRAFSMQAMLRKHRWASPLLFSRIVLSDAILREGDATIGCLLASGFTHAQADWAKNAIDNHIYGYMLQELNFPVTPEGYREAAQQALPMIPADQYPHLHEASRQITTGAYDGRTDFGFGLELILKGLADWIAAAPKTP